MLKHPLACFVVCLLAAAGVGCTTAKTVDVLESRLRHQEDMLANYESEMKRVKSELSVTRHEAEDLRVQLADSGQSTLPAEESGALFRASGIQFSALMTGGTDVDGEMGHDGLSVVLVPHDHDGELVKLPGNIEIEAFDLAQAGGAQRIGHWTFDQREVHNYWHKGVIQSGYQFELPWQTPPQTDKVLLVGHLNAANGRKFDTTLTVKIDPPTTALTNTPEGNVQQAVANEVPPFLVEQASATAPRAEITWADGEAPAARQEEPAPDRAHGFTRQSPNPAFGTSPFYRENDSRDNTTQARSMSGASFTRELNRTSPLGVQPSSPPRQRTGASMPPQTSSPPPPPLEDWWAKDEWSADETRASEPGVRTSDSFTEETMPQYR